MNPACRTRPVVRGGLITLAGLGLLGGAYLLAVVPPGCSPLYPRCLFRVLTGLNCPGCGMARALHALLNGRVAQAAAYNPLILIVLPLLTGWILRLPRLSDRPRAGHRTSSAHLPQFLITVLFALLIVFWICRNIPVYPLTVLAPHEI